MTLIKIKDLEAHLWHAAHIITEPIDASDYKTYIFPILFFKRICDVYDEEFIDAMEQVGDEELAKGDMFHRIQIPQECHWQDVFAETKDIGQALKDEFRGIELVNPKLHGIFGDVVEQIDNIVKATRFDGWQNSNSCPREIQKTLLVTLAQFGLGKDKELFSKAYSYIEGHY
jgi:type I restriction-modification system DNA methylase subunit